MLDDLRERRLALVVRSEEDRNALAGAFGRVEQKLHVADVAVSFVQRLNRNRLVSALVAGGLVFAPVLTKRWVRRAGWMLPLVVAVIREVRSARGSRHANDDDDGLASSAE